jgi:hypothetical protein
VEKVQPVEKGATRSREAANKAERKLSGTAKNDLILQTKKTCCKKQVFLKS